MSSPRTSKSASSSLSKSKSSSRKMDVNEGRTKLSLTNWILGGSLVTPADSKVALRRRNARGDIDRVMILADDESTDKDVAGKARSKRGSSKLNADKKVDETEKKEKEKKDENSTITSGKAINAAKVAAEVVCCEACEASKRTEMAKEDEATKDTPLEEVKKDEGKSCKAQEEETCEKCKAALTNKLADISEDSKKKDEASTISKEKNNDDNTNDFSPEVDAKILELMTAGRNTKVIATELKRNMKDVGKRIGQLKQKQKADVASKKDSNANDASITVEQAPNENRKTEDTSEKKDDNGWVSLEESNYILDDKFNNSEEKDTSANVSKSAEDAASKNDKSSEKDENTWEPPVDAWANNTSWPIVVNNDPDGTKIASNGNSDGIGFDWDRGGNNSSWDRGSAEVATNKQDATSGGGAMMSGGSGNGEVTSSCDNNKEDGLGFSNIFNEGIGDKTSATGWGVSASTDGFSFATGSNDTPTTYFTPSTFANDQKKEPIFDWGAPTGKKVHFEEENINATSKCNKPNESNGNENSNGWDHLTTSSINGVDNNQSNEDTNQSNSTPMPGGWDDSGISSWAGSNDTNQSNSQPQDQSQNQSKSETTNFRNHGNDSNNTSLNTTSSPPNTSMPGSWDQHTSNPSPPSSNMQSNNNSQSPSTNHFPCSQYLHTHSQDQSQSQNHQTSYPPPTPSYNRFANRLRPTAIFPAEDCTTLEYLAYRHEEDAWLHMQKNFFNWTGRCISACVIKAKFEEDGVRFDGLGRQSVGRKE